MSPLFLNLPHLLVKKLLFCLSSCNVKSGTESIKYMMKIICLCTYPICLCTYPDISDRTWIKHCPYFTQTSFPKVNRNALETFLCLLVLKPAVSRDAEALSDQVKSGSGCLRWGEKRKTATKPLLRKKTLAPSRGSLCTRSWHVQFVNCNFPFVKTGIHFQFCSVKKQGIKFMDVIMSLHAVTYFVSSILNIGCIA